MAIDVTGALRQTSLLRSVTARDLEPIAAAARLRTVRRGQVLFTAGDPSDTVILVVSGRVKVVVRSADGAELTLTVIQPGGMFGEIGIADGGPRSADAEALEDCRLLFVPCDLIADLCSRVPPARSRQYTVLRPIWQRAGLTKPSGRPAYLSARTCRWLR